MALGDVFSFYCGSAAKPTGSSCLSWPTFGFCTTCKKHGRVLNIMRRRRTGHFLLFQRGVDALRLLLAEHGFRVDLSHRGGTLPVLSRTWSPYGCYVFMRCEERGSVVLLFGQNEQRRRLGTKLMTLSS